MVSWSLRVCAWTNEGDGGGRAEGAPAIAEFAGGGGEEFGCLLYTSDAADE